MFSHIAVISLGKEHLPFPDFSHDDDDVAQADWGNGLASEVPSGESAMNRVYSAEIIDVYPRPGDGEPLNPDVWLFCLPMGILLTNDPSPPRYHPFILTDADGTRRYGGALTFDEPLTAETMNELGVFSSTSTFAPKSLMIMSKSPFFEAMREILLALYSHFPSGYGENVPFERMVQHIVSEIAAPPPNCRVSFYIGSQHISLANPPTHDLPLLSVSLRPLFECLCVHDVLKVVTCLLLEGRVVLLSEQSRSVLTIAAESLRALLFPFQFLHTYVPLLPMPMRDAILSPTPFLIGLERAYADPTVLRDADAAVVDLDRGLVALPMGWRMPELPEPERNLLYGRLDALLSPNIPRSDEIDWSGFGKKSEVTWTNTASSANVGMGSVGPCPSLFDLEVRRAFLLFYASLFGTFRRYLIYLQGDPVPIVMFNRRTFLKARATLDDDVDDPFLTTFLETQAFSAFIEDRASATFDRRGDLFERVSFHVHQPRQTSASPQPPDATLRTHVDLVKARDRPRSSSTSSDLTGSIRSARDDSATGDMPISLFIDAVPASEWRRLQAYYCRISDDAYFTLGRSLSVPPPSHVHIDTHIHAFAPFNSDHFAPSVNRIEFARQVGAAPIVASPGRVMSIRPSRKLVPIGRESVAAAELSAHQDVAADEYVNERLSELLSSSKGLAATDLEQLKTMAAYSLGQTRLSRLLRTMAQDSQSGKLEDKQFEQLVSLCRELMTMWKPTKKSSDNPKTHQRHSSQGANFTVPKAVLKVGAVFYRHTATGLPDFVYSKVTDFGVWKMTPFWTDAFIEDLGNERCRIKEEAESESMRSRTDKTLTETIEDVVQREENIIFALLGHFIFNQLNLGVTAIDVRVFVKKMCHVNALSNEMTDTILVLVNNMARLQTIDSQSEEPAPAPEPKEPAVPPPPPPHADKPWKPVKIKPVVKPQRSKSHRRVSHLPPRTRPRRGSVLVDARSIPNPKQRTSWFGSERQSSQEDRFLSVVVHPSPDSASPPEGGSARFGRRRLSTMARRRRRTVVFAEDAGEDVPSPPHKSPSPPPPTSPKQNLHRCSSASCKNLESEEFQFLVCSGCSKARYCSRTCQINDWTLGNHQETCRPPPPPPPKPDAESPIQSFKRMVKSKSRGF